MLGNAITTELQLLAARERANDLALSFGRRRAVLDGRDSTRRGEQPAEREPCSPAPAIGRPAEAA